MFTLDDGVNQIQLAHPKPNSQNSELLYDVRNYDFVSGGYAVINYGVSGNRLSLRGLSIASKNDYCLSFPIVFTGGYLKFNALKIISYFDFLTDVAPYIEQAMKGRLVKITNLDDEHDGYYLITSFSYRNVPKAKDIFEWNLELEFVRGLE